MKRVISKHNIENKNRSNIDRSSKDEKILCNHCKRTKANGISCRGICVADNEY